MADPILNLAAHLSSGHLERTDRARYRICQTCQASRILEVLVPALEGVHAKREDCHCEACDALTQARAIAEGKA